MSEDEKVNGAEIAAKILNQLDSEHKERLVKAIEARSPDAAALIQENLFSFEDIATLHPRGVQILIQSVEHSDLVLSLKKASDKVKGILFENMSERKQIVVTEDLNALPPTPISDVESAKRRIIIKLDELRTAGLIITQGGSSNDTWV